MLSDRDLGVSGCRPACVLSCMLLSGHTADCVVCVLSCQGHHRRMQARAKREQQLSHWERCQILLDRARLGSKCIFLEAAPPIRSGPRELPPTSSNVSSSIAARIASAKSALTTGRAEKLLLAVAIAADAEACSPG